VASDQQMPQTMLQFLPSQFISPLPQFFMLKGGKKLIKLNNNQGSHPVLSLGNEGGCIFMLAWGAQEAYA